MVHDEDTLLLIGPAVATVHGVVGAFDVRYGDRHTVVVTDVYRGRLGSVDRGRLEVICWVSGGGEGVNRERCMICQRVTEPRNSGFRSPAAAL